MRVIVTSGNALLLELGSGHVRVHELRQPAHRADEQARLLARAYDGAMALAILQEAEKA